MYYLCIDPFKKMKLSEKKILRKDSKSWVSFPIEHICTPSHLTLFHNIRYFVHYHTDQVWKNPFSVNQEV